MLQARHTYYTSIAFSIITTYLFICFLPASLLECKLWKGRNYAYPVQHYIPSVYPNSRHIVTCIIFVAWMNGWWMDGWSKEIKHVPGPPLILGSHFLYFSLTFQIRVSTGDFHPQQTIYSLVEHLTVCNICQCKEWVTAKSARKGLTKETGSLSRPNNFSEGGRSGSPG